ncbi:MAG TPA: hypothetical protein VLB00_11780 [Gemmatimonadales bacterium]|jgi:hypothetical protein|nr:hypothetical protein [Gemmatimonadales bacterium]
MAESVSSSALARLLEQEQRLEVMLADARSRAAELVARAEQEARGGALALEAELAEAAARAEVDRTAHCAERLAELTRDGERSLARFRNIGPAQITELAQWVASRVLDGATPGAKP